MALFVSKEHIYLEEDERSHKYVYNFGEHKNIRVNSSNLEVESRDGIPQITIKCFCRNAFTEKCNYINLSLLCKVVMLILDGAYLLRNEEESQKEQKEEKCCKKLVQGCLEKMFFNMNFLEQLNNSEGVTALVHAFSAEDGVKKKVNVKILKLAFIYAIEKNIV
ncbi:E3 [Psittacine adenovirus 2]|uniref:E3 n=1 Tax=Psittacine adenovirus 2 TaxID=1301246 RepID=A0ABX8SNB3_9ADEN|nr:E3 [Psittacine adenovirus 2]